MSEIKDFFGPEVYSSVPYPAGSILVLPWLPTNIETQVPGFHYCDGTSYSKITYATLYAAIGDYYGSDLENFQVPDYRGLFLRGRDDGSGEDPETGLRTLNPNATMFEVGSQQPQSIISHIHLASIDAGGTGGVGWYDLPPCSGSPCGDSVEAQSDAAGGVETRPMNYSCVFVIKY